MLFCTCLGSLYKFFKNYFGQISALGSSRFFAKYWINWCIIKEWVTTVASASHCVQIFRESCIHFLSLLYCYGEVDSNNDSTASHGANHWWTEGDGSVQSGVGFVCFETSSLCRWSPLRGPLLSPVELCPISSHLWDTFFFSPGVSTDKSV